VPAKTFTIPLYAQIMNAVQERIGDGTYGPGAMIPSERELGAEFGASRPVVVRALGLLEQDGWIEAEHGRGRFVRRAHAIARRDSGAGRAALGVEKAAGVRMLLVEVVPAPTRAAVALGLGEAEPVFARRRLVTAGGEPVQLVTVYARPSLVEGTQLTRPILMTVDPLAHLGAVKGVRFDYASDRIGARHPDPDEANQLGLTRRDIVLTVLAVAYDTTATPIIAADVVAAAGRMDLEDTFPLG
jgi:GntR family transcriptional regulator